MIFLWGYNHDYRQGLKRLGLLDSGTGLRFIQNPATEHETLLFNTAMRENTDFFDPATKNNDGLLIDRGCGGYPYRQYVFDPELAARYADILKNRFFGVLLCDWINNTSDDWQIVRRKTEMPDSATNEEFLQQGALEDYRKGSFPQNLSALVNDAKFGFYRCLENFGGYLTLAEGSFQSYDIGLKLGARLAMAKTGAGVPLTRLQMAAVRGMSRAHGKKWGVYYASGNNRKNISGDTVPHRHKSNPCGISEPSHAFLRRMLYHAFLSGASFLAQEKDHEEMFSDKTYSELTPYGKVVREIFNFCRVQNKRPVLAPVALVSDPDEPPLETLFLSGTKNDISGYAPSPEQLKRRSFFQTLFYDPSGRHYGNEWHAMTNSLFPDAFDILYGDAPVYILRQYSMIVYMGNREQQVRDRLGAFWGEWLSLTDLETTTMHIYQCLRKTFPVWVEGNVHWMVNRADNEHILTIFNNEGVTRDNNGNDTYDKSAAAEATIMFAGRVTDPVLSLPGKNNTNRPGLMQLSRGTYSLTVPPGAVAMISFS